jgi:hypothetical protein
VYQRIALRSSAFVSLQPNTRWVTGFCLWTAVLFGSVFSQENYSTWSDSQRVYINTTSSGANVTGTVANFPVLIRLNPSNFTRFSRTKPLGADIRFATSTGVHLNYQIERWKDGASDADTADIWVKVPSVSGNNSTQFIRMYYGNANAVDSSKGQLVFETSNGFIGTWHLAEDPAGGTAGAIKDATINGLNATSRGTMTTADLVNGVIGKGHDFDGTDDADSIPYAPALNTANAVTLSAWVFVRKFQSYSRIISRGMPGNTNPWTVYSLSTQDTFHRWRGEVSSGDTGSQKFVHGKGDLGINAWYHVAFTYDKSNVIMYRNGVPDSVSSAATIGISSGQTTPLMIGKSNYGTNPFNGIIDEAIAAKVARSADWIKLSYETQKPAASCVSLQASVAPTITTQPTGSSVLVGANATMTVAASGTATLWYEWYKNSVATGNLVSGQTTATLSLSNVQVTDAGNYICVVHNEYGFAQSTPATLTVTSPNSPPTITAQPKDTVIYQTQTATMSVLATGSGTLTYAWYKVVNGSDVAIAGQTTATLTIANAALSDSSLYRCIVTNEFGSTSSNTAKLTVSNGSPTITVNPKDTTVTASTQARMSVTAVGLGTLTYAWYKNAAGTGTVLSTTAVLTIASALLSDAGNYLCVVSNDRGSATSLPGKLTVNDGRPVITVQPHDTSVFENTPWSMSVTATGDGLNYAWYKTGDPNVKAANRVFSISSALTTDAGTYYCIVKNTFGACTSSAARVNVSPNRQVSNPIMLEGRLIDSMHVLLSVKHYAGLVSLVPDQSFTWSPDTVLIWYRQTTYPTSTVVTSTTMRISKTRLQAAGGDQFDTLVSVGKIGCNNYYFKGSVKWKNTSVTRDSIPPFGDNTSGATVTMCDNSLLKVPVTLSFEYTPPNDSVEVTMNGFNLAGIRWDIISSVVLQYSVAQANYVDVTIVPSIVQGLYMHKLAVRNTRFSGDTTTVKWRLFFRGMYNNQSDTVRAESKVGARRPDNSLTLGVGKTDAMQVTLAWTNSSVTPYDSFQIWYATTSIPTTTDPSPSIYSRQGAAGTAATTVIRNLKELTTYYFGIQGLRAGIWSLIPVTAQAIATTLEDTSKAIPNTMKILGVVYDTSTYKIRITYQIDPLGFQHQVGFTWLQGDSVPRPLPSEFTMEPSGSPRTGEITLNDVPGSAVTYVFDMGNASPPLEYAKGYYFGGWVSKVGEKWALPTDSSLFYFTIPQPKVVPVIIFKNTDVVTAFNNDVVLRKVVGVEQQVILRLIETLPLDVSGLVKVSNIAFKLETNVTSPIALQVGLKYNAGLIPQGASQADVRMYYYDPARAIWLVDTATITNNTSESVMYIRKYLSDCKYPFVLAVDTVQPTITVTGNADSAVCVHDSITMTVKVDDNIANPHVSMYVGRGDEELRLDASLRDMEVTRGVVVPWAIDTNDIQGESGIRMHIIANDGRNSALTDVSRDIRLSDADAASTVKEVWIPLGSTAVLDSPGVKQALDEYGSTPESWRYDTHLLRLFRFIKKDWVEYSEAQQDSFSFVPGRVIWLKTRVDTVYNFGNGHSVSLKSPYAINLPAKCWTDFCLPYRFDIRIGDVLKANDDPLVATSLHFYKWDKSAPDGRYYGKEFYLPQNGGSKLTDTLYYQHEHLGKAAYTVWNDHTADIVLKIPGTPLALSTVGVGAPKTAAQSGRAIGWSVAVRSSAPDGELSPVFCAYVKGGSGTLAYPQPPTWSKVNVGIYDRERQEVYGNLITHTIENGGYSYELMFENGSADRTRVSYTVERLAGESAFEIAVIDPASGTIAAGESNLSVEVAGNGSEYRLLAIGSPEYIDGFGQSLQRGSFTVSRISPNPFRRMVRIEYMVPYGGIETVRCDIINHLGRVVWSARPEGRIHPGRNSVIWTPDRKNRTSSGAYFVRLVGYDGKGRKTGEKTAKVLYLN